MSCPRVSFGAKRVKMLKPPNEVQNDQLLEPSRVDPQTDRTAPDKGTKLFVLFFFLIVPPLGIVLLAAVVWSLWKLVMGNA